MTVVRPAVPDDVDAIAAIYAREVLVGFATFDLEPPPRQRWVDKLDGTTVGEHLLVAESGDGAVDGYASSSSYRPRPAYGHTRETSVYVAPTAQGRGVGRRLYDELLARLRADGMHLALAGVALPNPASVALHEACGFEHLGTMREVGRKFDRWIDVAWYQLIV